MHFCKAWLMNVVLCHREKSKNFYSLRLHERLLFGASIDLNLDCVLYNYVLHILPERSDLVGDVEILNLVFGTTQKSSRQMSFIASNQNHNGTDTLQNCEIDASTKWTRLPVSSTRET